MGHMIGERIVLREYQMEDIPYARAWANDTETTDMLSHIFLMPQTYDMTEQYFRGIVEGRSGGYHFIIAHKESQEYIGQIDLFSVQQVDRTAELGMVIGNGRDRGQGYGREALSLLLAYAFERCNLHRVYLTVKADNLRAQRCYEACGFQREGVLREHFFNHGVYHDIVQMGVLRREWRART